jgi:hypothetical protein
MQKLSMTTAALLLAVCAAPVFAQDQTKPDSIVLETKVGSVMTSTGGDYQSADVGKKLVEGESMMLNDGAKAEVVYYYDNGRRKCVEKYSGPNTFVIDDSCKAAGWMASNPKGTALIIGGAVVAAALLTGGGSDNNGPPISAGAR